MGTSFYRRRMREPTMIQVTSLVAHGCSIPAVKAAFGRVDPLSSTRDQPAIGRSRSFPALEKLDTDLTAFEAWLETTLGILFCPDQTTAYRLVRYLAEFEVCSRGAVSQCPCSAGRLAPCSSGAPPTCARYRAPSAAVVTTESHRRLLFSGDRTEATAAGEAYAI